MDRIAMPMGAVTCADYERTCDRCQGAGGKNVTETSGGATRTNWKSCDKCRGRGRA
jgi:DnaJ-class molecular chaperone